MFTYMHTYMPENWKGQILRGLIDEHAGVRFCENIELAEDHKFNNLAAVGTSFYHMMKETRMPMYIDRLQGGCFLENYPYNWELVKIYEDMLGDKFWGFQMHEWASNLFGDLKRIRESVGTQEWNVETISREVLKNHPYDYVWMEARPVEEHVKWGDPKNVEEVRANLEDLFVTRNVRARGRLVPCDSYALAYHLELKNGVKHFMPEVGAQTSNTRVQVAYARGMARTNDASFGVYYEPWGGEPFSTCSYHVDNLNEWNVETYGPFSPKGPNGGSSRSLQRRIHYYAYFAGAEFISEEWSAGNTFYDWHDYELTPYGKVKYDFLQLVKKYPQEEIGTPYTPIAIVLSKDTLPLWDIYNQDNTYFKIPLTGELAKTTALARRVVSTLLSDACEMIGCETHSLINSKVPDAVDVIHEDYLVLHENYEYFINCTGSEEFEKNHKCCRLEDAKELLNELMPCKVEGNVHWMVNRTKEGWMLIMFNHSGIHRSVADGEYLLPGSGEFVKITLKNGLQMVQLEGDSKLSLSDGVYELTLPAGGWFLGRFS